MRLFDEAVELVRIERADTLERRAEADIAVAGLSMRRNDPHRDDMAFMRMLHARGDRCMERFGIGDRMVGGHHHHDAVVILCGNRQRRDRQRGCGVAPGGFQDQPAWLAAGAQLLGGREAMFFVRHHDQLIGERVSGVERVEAAGGGLQQRVGAQQADQLLRILLARHGPQTGAGAARQDDGMNLQLDLQGSGGVWPGVGDGRRNRCCHGDLLLGAG
jgi:hypothetical protein